MESYRVPRPPKGGGVHEPAPHLDPPLRDMPEWPGPRLDTDPEPFEVERTDGDDELLAAASEVARGDERVRELLADHRHAWLGVSALAAKDEKRASAVAVVYDYDRNMALEVALAGEGRELEVVGIDDAAYHPPLSDEEVEHATELARGDRRVEAHIAEELESTAILVSDVEQGDRHHGRRRIEVMFGRPDERLPRVRALVDLGEERVLGVTADQGHREPESEEQS